MGTDLDPVHSAGPFTGTRQARLTPPHQRQDEGCTFVSRGWVAVGPAEGGARPTVATADQSDLPHPAGFPVAEASTVRSCRKRHHPRGGPSGGFPSAVLSVCLSRRGR